MDQNPANTAINNIDQKFSDVVGALVRTKDEANRLLTEIEVLERSLYKVNSENLEFALENSVRAITADAVKPLFSQGNEAEVFKKIKKAVADLSYISLTIAFEPTSQSINRFYVWVKQNLVGNCALSLEIDRSILGGAVIEYKGKIKKFTLIDKIDEYFLNTNVNV